MSYCTVAGSDPFHSVYHDQEYGFPLHRDDAFFERLMMEINQAGLSWRLILRKREGLRRAYDDFAIDVVADYGDEDRARLLADPGIIRNRLKVDAAIENARRIRTLRHRHGSFRAWLDHHHPLSHEEWTRLFRREFVFMGSEIVREFLVSTGYLPGAHEESCPVYSRILALQPAWTRAA